MENTIMIWALKEKIKTLSAEQKLLKMARKTTMPKEQWEAIRINLGRARDWTPSDAAWQASSNSMRITACLNYYHELRGSSFRHNVDPHIKYYYDKYIAELKAELAKS